MSYGFEATNTSGQVLISDKTKNLHFYKKALLVLTKNDDYDNGYTNTYAAVVFTYFTDCYSTPFPFFTLYPSSNGSISCGITRIYKANPGWYIEILVGPTNGYYLASQYNYAPEVYIFCDLKNRPAQLISTNKYGMIVYGSGGPTDTACFDSRYRPLVISNGYGTAVPPDNPFDNEYTPEPGGSYYFADNAFMPNKSAVSAGLSYNSNEMVNNFGVKNSTFLAGPEHIQNIYKPIYCYSAIAQCEREKTWTDSATWDDRHYGGGSTGTFSSVCKYWYMYRSSIKVDSAGNLFCTWVPHRRGTVGISARNDQGGYSVAGFIFGVGLGLLTGGLATAAIFGLIGATTLDLGGGQTLLTNNGAPPFNDLTLNMQASTVLVSDGSLYD